jgi:hypothetical protein
LAKKETEWWVAIGRHTVDMGYISKEPGNNPQRSQSNAIELGCLVDPNALSMREETAEDYD